LILRPGGAWRGSGLTLRDISAGDNCRAGPVKERFGRVQKSIKKSFSGTFKTAHLADIANLSGHHSSPRRFSFSVAIATNRNRESAGLLTRKISSTCPSNNGSVRKSPVQSNRAVEPTQKIVVALFGGDLPALSHSIMMRKTAT
jgi:hypothetical protein